MQECALRRASAVTSISPTLAERILAVAARAPAAPFLLRPGRPAIAYGTLAGQIGRVRQRFSSWGIAPGDIVAGFDRSRALMAMACASLPSSSTFAPLGASLTVDAYAGLLRRLRPKAVLTPEDPGDPLRVAASALGIPAMRAIPDASGGFSLELERARAERVEPLARPGHAYVIVTSGTTGRPKLAPQGHSQLTGFADAMIDLLRMDARDVGYAIQPFNLAGGVRSSIVIPALAGASIVCLDEGDVDGFFRAIDAFAPTHLAAAFSIHHAILRRAPAFPAQVAASRFRFLRSTAGRLDPDECDAIERLFRAPVLVGYGASEVSGIAHDPMPPRPRKRGSVGVPVGGEVRAVDADGRPCRPGETGELVVRGGLVFDGYLDDPELDARAFDGEWFRTGDAGHVDEDGYVFITGRLAEMINRGGEKIAPAGIDRAIEAVPGVREAGAFGVPHPTLGEEIAAAVVLEPGATIGEPGIVAHLRESLGPRRLPRRLYFVDRLPRTEAGKLRRGELAAWVGAGSESRPPESPPGAEARSPTEAALAGLWSSILRCGPVERDDNFFLLGGDSMSAAELVRQVEAVFGVALPLHAMFDGMPTLAAMAQAIDRSRAGSPR